MLKLIMQLIEPSTKEAIYAANVWLLGNDASLIASEQELAIKNVDAWVAENTKHKSVDKVELIVLAPSASAHVRLLNINKGQIKYLANIVPVLMEPFIAQPIEDAHFAHKVVSDNLVMVGVVCRTKMALWSALLEKVSAVKKTLVLPQFLLYEHFESSDSIRCLGDVYKNEGGHVFSVPESFRLNLDIAPQRLSTEPFIQSLAAVKSWQSTNLLIGDYVYRPDNQKNSLLFALSSCLSVTILISSSLWFYSVTSINRSQIDYIEKKANAAFLSLAPEEGRVVNLRRQIEGRLRTISSNQKFTGAQQSPYMVLSQIEKAKQNTKGENTPQLIAYRDGVYILEWTAEKQDALEDLRHNLKNEGLNAFLDQVILQDKKYVGSYRIQGKL